MTRGRQVWFRLRAEVLSWCAAAVVLAAVVGVGPRGFGAECGAVGGVATMYAVWLAWAQADAADGHHALRAGLRAAARVLQVGKGGAVGGLALVPPTQLAPLQAGALVPRWPQ